MSIDQVTLQNMLSEMSQVWVRHRKKAKGRAPHWARARLISVAKDFAVIKPIKHGGRIEKVPLETIKLWNSMNSKHSINNESSSTHLILQQS
jgi:hypothetical protein